VAKDKVTVEVKAVWEVTGQKVEQPIGKTDIAARGGAATTSPSA